MAELNANGFDLELKDGQPVKYTRSIADVYNIASVQCSYTSSFSLPKTPQNTEAMQQLGIVGDSSEIPYSRIPSRLSEFGAAIVSNGWLQVKETSDEYKVAIIDGMIDFFKAIENKTLGKDLDLSVFNHEKDIDSVIDSFTNDFYKYLIADYNGKRETTVGEDTAINIDYLVPCFNVFKLLEIVMQSFGFTFDPTNLEDLQSLYITYPKDPASTVTTELYADLFKGLFVRNAFRNPQGLWTTSWFMPWTTTNINEGSMSGNSYVIPETGVYQIRLELQAYIEFFTSLHFFLGYRPLKLSLRVNGVDAYTLDGNPDPEDIAETTIFQFLNQGDQLSVFLYTDSTEFDGGPLYFGGIHHHHTNVDIYKTNQGNINFVDAFADFAIKDFFKECIWFTGTTPVITGTNIKFLSLNERLDFSNSQDLSESFVSRDSETYTMDGMAQRNSFRHKYHDENRKDQDGYLVVANANLSDEKVLAQSKMYAPEQYLATFASQGSETFQTRKFRIWNTETKQDQDGEIEIEYKGLTGRFYFIREKASPSGEWLFASDAVAGSDQTVTGVIPTGDSYRTTYAQMVPEKYLRYSFLLNKFRSYDFTMAFSLSQFLGVDLTKPMYLEQEAAYFMINKLTFESGRVSKLEAVKIQRNIVPALQNETVIFQVRAQDGYAITFKIPVVHDLDEIIEENSTVTINGHDFEITNQNVSGGFVNFYVSIPVPQWQLEPSVDSFTIRMSNDIYFADFIYQGPSLVFTVGEMYQGITKTGTASIQNV